MRERERERERAGQRDRETGMKGGPHGKPEGPTYLKQIREEKACYGTSYKQASYRVLAHFPCGISNKIIQTPKEISNKNTLG